MVKTAFICVKFFLDVCEKLLKLANVLEAIQKIKVARFLLTTVYIHMYVYDLGYSHVSD